MNKKLITGALSFAFSATLDYWNKWLIWVLWFFCGVTAIAVSGGLFAGLMVLAKTKFVMGYLGVVLIVIAAIAMGITASAVMGSIQAGLYKAAVDFCRDGEESFKVSAKDRIVEGRDNWLGLILASLLYSFIILGGSLLLIVPGIYFGVRFRLFRYFISEGFGVMDSLRMSWRITDGHVSEVFLLGLAELAGDALGSMTFGLGKLITMPFFNLMNAYVYCELRKGKSGSESCCADDCGCSKEISCGA